MDLYPVYITKTFAQQTLQNWQLVFMSAASRAVAGIGGWWGWDSSSQHDWSQELPMWEDPYRCHKYNPVEGVSHSLHWFLKLIQSSPNFLSLLAVHSIDYVSIALMPGKKRKLRNQRWRQFCQPSRIALCQLVGVRGSPRMENLRLKNSKESIHNTFHRKNRNQIIFSWASGSWRILQWLSGGVVRPSSGCTCLEFL